MCNAIGIWYDFKVSSEFYCILYESVMFFNTKDPSFTGADPGFQVRVGAHLKKLRRAEGGAKIFGVFRVKNHDFMPKKIFELQRETRNLLGYFV
jgi:hypothetical protein